jgi:hypothetical protein
MPQAKVRAAAGRSVANSMKCLMLPLQIPLVVARLERSPIPQEYSKNRARSRQFPDCSQSRVVYKLTRGRLSWRLLFKNCALRASLIKTLLGRYARGKPIGHSGPLAFWHSPCKLFRFLGSFRGVLLSLHAQFSRGFVIASVMRGGGGCVGVGGIDVQFRCIVLVALGHFVLHIPANALPLSLESPTCNLQGLINRIQSSVFLPPKRRPSALIDSSSSKLATN